MNKDCSKSLINYKLGTKIEYSLNNGLKVILIPKKGFSKFVCSLSTNYGAVDNKFIGRSDGLWHTLPFGVAHYLEHKMFEIKDEDGNISDVNEIFSRMGIEANAYTDYGVTNFYIKGSDLLYEGLSLLLNKVYNPCFNSDSVEKERGIILQEAKGYSDDPRERMVLSMYNNVYDDIPYFEDVVGSDKDINSITAKDLYIAYDTFYHPSNMTLLAIGDFNEKDIMTFLNNVDCFSYFDRFNSKDKPVRYNFKEKKCVNKAYDSIPLDVDIPMARIMVKLQNEYMNQELFSNLLKAEATIKILIDLMFGALSDNYQIMLDKELIASEFNTSVSCDKLSSNITISCNSHKPKDFVDYVMNVINNLDTFEVKEEYFLAAKRSLYASLIYIFNDVEETYGAYIEYHYKDVNLFEAVSLLDEITIDEVNKVKNIFMKDNISILIGEKKEA